MITMHLIIKNSNKFHLLSIFPPTSGKYSDTKKHYTSLKMLNQLLFLLYLEQLYTIDNMFLFTDKFGWAFKVLGKAFKIVSYPIGFLTWKIKKYMDIHTVAEKFYEIKIDDENQTITIN